MKQTLEATKNTITNMKDAIGSAASSVGKSMIDGIKSGVMSAVGGLISAARNAVSSALSAAKAAIGMGSPAKAWMPLGESMAQGAAVGLVGSSPMLAGAGAYAAGAAYAGAARSATYNNQRSVNLTQVYNGVPAAPSMDFAMANSLAGV